MEMFGGMLIGRRIAAAYMTTTKAQAKMDPGVARFQTLFAALRVGMNVPNLVQMGTLLHTLFPVAQHFAIAPALGL